MTDNQIIRLIRPIIKDGLLNQGITVKVKQANPPTIQGADKDMTIYLTKLPDKRYGHPERKSVWDEANQKMVDTDTQKIEATYQATVWQRETPETEVTSLDVAHLTAALLQTWETIDTLKAAGAGILRVTDVRCPYFKDDRDQFQPFPSFDFTITHERVIIRTGKTITTVEPIIKDTTNGN